MTRPDPREVLSADELADYYAHRRMEAQPMRRVRTGPANPNNDGWDGDEFYGVPGHWDDYLGMEGR